MARSVPTPRELDVLKALWELEPASVRAVHRRLGSRGLAFNTVQTVLRIMDRKRLIGHRTEGCKFVYTAILRREELAARFLHKVFDGCLTDLVATLLRIEEVSVTRLKELERLVRRARCEAADRRRRFQDTPGSYKGASSTRQGGGVGAAGSARQHQAV